MTSGEGASRILSNALYRSAADVGAKIASVVLFVAIARTLGEAGFGVFAFGLAFVTLVTAVGGFGQDAVLTREVARDRSRLDLYFPNTLALKVAIGLPAVTLATAVIALVEGDSATRKVVMLLGLAVLAELGMATCFATFQAYERLRFVPVALLAQRFFTAIVGVVALLAGANVVDVAGIYLAGAALGLVVAVGLVFRYIARPRLQLRPRMWWPLLRAALPVGLLAVSMTALVRADTTMLAFFESDDVVGNYGAAYRVFEVTFFLSWSVSEAVYPVLSRLTRTSEPRVGLVYERAIKLVVALTLPLALAVAILAEPLVELLYGPAFDEAGRALALLAPAIALYPVAYVTAYLLLSQDRQRALTLTYALVALENVLANLVLIPAFSLNGAAAGASVSFLLLVVPLTALALGTAGRVDWVRMLSGPLVGGALAAGALILLADEPAAAAAAGALAYVTALVAWERSLYPDDARVAWRFVRRQRTAA